MRLLVVEPHAEGHHLALYTRLIFREAWRRGWSVTLLTTESARAHPAFQLAAAEYHGQLETILVADLVLAKSDSSIELFRNQLGLWKTLQRAARKHDGFSEFDMIYCVNFDYFEKALSVLGSPFGQRPFSGMFMNPKFHRAPLGIGPRSRADGLYQVLFERLLGIPTLKRLLVIDEPFRDYCAQARLKGTKKIHLIRDVGELTEAAPVDGLRGELGISEEVFLILVYGSISRRKGLEELLRGVTRLHDERIVVLVAGEPDAEMRSELGSPYLREAVGAGRLIVKQGFLDSHAECQAFRSANAVWLGYVGGAFGSSGVLYQAGAAGLPVIAMDGGLIGWMVKKHELGVTMDPADPQRVAEAVKLLVDHPEKRRYWAENGRRLSESHTGEAFGRAVCDAVAPY